MDWFGATSLPDYVFRLIESGQTAGPEISALMKYYGAQKLETLYQEEKDRRQASTLRDTKETRIINPETSGSES